MKIFNFGSSQSIGFGHNSDFDKCPYKIFHTAFPRQISHKLGYKLYNFARPGESFHFAINRFYLNKHLLFHNDIVFFHINSDSFIPPVLHEGKLHKYYNASEIDAEDDRELKTKMMNYIVNYYDEQNEIYHAMSKLIPFLEHVTLLPFRMFIYTCKPFPVIPQTEDNSVNIMTEHFHHLLRQANVFSIHEFLNDDPEIDERHYGIDQHNQLTKYFMEELGYDGLV